MTMDSIVRPLQHALRAEATGLADPDRQLHLRQSARHEPPSEGAGVHAVATVPADPVRDTDENGKDGVQFAI